MLRFRCLGSVAAPLAWSLAFLGMGCGAEASAKHRDDASLDASTGDASALVACDPLAANEQPISLRTPLAVGKSADGTLYVVDEPAGGGEARVFVSEGMDVYRKRTLGSGADGDVDYTVSFEDGPTPQRLVFHREQGQVTGIALAHDNDRTFLDALASSAEPLMVESDEVVADLPLHNLPGEIVLEYLATLDEGGSEYTLVVTRPRDDWTYDDFRVFYGTDGLLIERALANAGRGSYTYLDFEVDGAAYLATFGSSLSPIASTLKTGADVYDLQVDEGASQLPSGESFECLPCSSERSNRSLGTSCRVLRAGSQAPSGLRDVRQRRGSRFEVHVTGAAIFRETPRVAAPLGPIPARVRECGRGCRSAGPSSANRLSAIGQGGNGTRRLLGDHLHVLAQYPRMLE